MSACNHNLIRLLHLMARAKPSSLLNLEVQFGTARLGVPHVMRLRQWALAAYLAHAGRHVSAKKIKVLATVSLRVVGAAESRRLNREWRGKDKSTNVLSFPAGDVLSEDGAYTLGDLAICAQVVAREARQQHKKPDAHWAHMVIHGVFHLLGYDHEVSRDARIMEALEVKTMQQLGFANPYEC